MERKAASQGASRPFSVPQLSIRNLFPVLSIQLFYSPFRERRKRKSIGLNRTMRYLRRGRIYTG